MTLRATTLPALLALLGGLALAAPAGACPMQQQNAENSSPVRLAADTETEAVEEDLRPNEVPESAEAPKGSAEEDHSKHQQGGEVEDEAVQKDLAPDTVPAGE